MAPTLPQKVDLSRWRDPSPADLAPQDSRQCGGPGSDTDRTLHVSFSVKNDGTVAGAEVPQVYLGIDYAGEPPLRLGGWDKIHLNPEEVQQVSITLSPRTQSIWDTSVNDWRAIPDAVVCVGASSRDIRLRER